MKVYCKPPVVKSRSLERVASMLPTYAPYDLEFTDRKKDADLVVLHVIGRCEQVLAEADELLRAGKKYAVIQYCVRSTQKPNVDFWNQLWYHAEAVWSYYDLNQLSDEDGYQLNCNFYHAPLGACGSTFEDYSNGEPRPYLAMTHGQSWLTEGVREVVWASRQVGRKAIHLGQSLHRGMDVYCHEDVSDAHLAQLYSQVQYVCPLRRIEGFELPAAEGLLCGARPVLYDKPHYRGWYGELAEYIQEGPREQVLEQLTALFQGPYRAVTACEKKVARERFYWPRVVKGFWEAVL